jgi:hypothetical protein
MNTGKSLEKSHSKSRDKKSRSKKNSGKKNRDRWYWWPLLLGIAATPVAVRTAEILPLTGPAGLTKLHLLYPYVMLLKEHALGLSEVPGEIAARIMLYLQFPLYGLFASLAIRRRSWRTALAYVAVAHLAGFGLLRLLARP